VRKDRLREELKKLEQVRSDPLSPQSVSQLRAALAHKNNHVVARAAQILAEANVKGLEDDLVTAFERFMDDPLKSDPGCAAKTAVIETLYHLGCEREEPFLQGIRHLQPEPTYEGKQDTAARLRAFSALGLSRSLYPDKMLELADLLADPELDARLGAVHAVAASRQMAGVPLLRFKALVGDEDPRVLHECFRSLLEVDPESSLDFVAAFLMKENEALCESAALALGESRLEGAFEVLRAWCQENQYSRLLHTGLTAVALLRSRPAVDYLVALVADGPVSVAREAINALDFYRDEPQTWRKVENAASQRTDLDV
jgi:hypothetical protein